MQLLGCVAGLALRELRNPEECCGFGGSFCVKYPEISTHIGDQKIDDIVATGASHVIGGDLGCLLHLEGRMQRRGIAVRAVHVAEVLAGMALGCRPWRRLARIFRALSRDALAQTDAAALAARACAG